MADTIRIQADMRDLQAQIAELKKTLGGQSASVAEQVRDTASSALGSAARGVEGVARQARNEAVSVAGLVKEHPTATSTALVGVALLGAAIGYLLGSQTQQDVPRRRWY